MSRTETSQFAASPVFSRRKRVLFKLATIVLLALFAEASLQVFYRLSVGRWLWEWWAIPIFEADPVRVYRVKPNLNYVHKTREFTATYCTDQNGMRTICGQPGPTVAKPDGTFRILVLGPSFAFGWGVNYEDAYIYRMAQSLRVPGKRLELINLGTPSQSPPYQVQWLKAAGYRYEPDLIIQTVYGDIQDLDVGETLPANKPGVRNGYLYPSDKMTWSLWVRRVRAYSALLFYGWHVYDALFRPRIAEGEGKEFYQPSGPASATGENELEIYKHYVDYVGRAVTNRHEIAFMFMPVSHVVRPADITRVAHHGGVGSSFEIRRRAAAFSGLAQSNHIHFINPTPALVENDQKTRMYNLYDIHLTVAGNKVVADYSTPIVQKWILEGPGGRQGATEATTGGNDQK